MRTRKLSLHRSTLRHLNHELLELARGGRSIVAGCTTAVTVPDNCTATWCFSQAGGWCFKAR